MNPIFLLAGAPAVGKSTTGQALAAKYTKSIHIKVDDLRSMVVSGLVHPGQWTQELVDQLLAARASAIAMARIYHNTGFAVVIDDFYDPQSDLAEYQELIVTERVLTILLYPSFATAQERNIKRSGNSNFSEYIARGIDAVYGHLESSVDVLRAKGWMVLDTSHQTVEETVREIMERSGTE
jgi:chloramphenicol 3-O-phosphotransferase